VLGRERHEVGSLNWHTVSSVSSVVQMFFSSALSSWTNRLHFSELFFYVLFGANDRDRDLLRIEMPLGGRAHILRGDRQDVLHVVGDVIVTSPCRSTNSIG